MTAKGNEMSPSKMPLMRIRSVEIVFEDEMSTCTDTGILDRSIGELIVSDSSDDSTKCVDDLEHLQIEREYDSVTLNADGDLSDDNSVSLTKEDIVEDIPKIETPQIGFQDVDEPSHVQSESVTLAIDVTLSPNVSEFGDSGRFTEEACSSHFETVPIEDALLSNTFDAINIEKTSTLLSSYEMSDVCSISAESSTCTARLYEYIDSNSDDSDSDNTATCEADAPPQLLTSIGSPDDHTLCDSYDLQYDSFIDMGKF
ncbi:uncharacterized protein LOC142973131 [Anticarsia gemmatalis]|uniref:uncharacterized protein LOC142973131 n=1 Tax=Anticarsia gemmatalis TaxID=129554 RepID=UPI003F761CBE